MTLKIGQTWSNGKTSRVLMDVRGYGVTYCAAQKFIALGENAPHHHLFVWQFLRWIKNSRADLIAGPQ